MRCSIRVPGNAREVVDRKLGPSLSPDPPVPAIPAVKGRLVRNGEGKYLSVEEVAPAQHAQQVDGQQVRVSPHVLIAARPCNRGRRRRSVRRHRHRGWEGKMKEAARHQNRSFTTGSPFPSHQPAAICEVTWLMANCPLGVRTSVPADPLTLVTSFCNTHRAALLAVSPWPNRSQIVFATATRMMLSPHPVIDTAPASLSAYTPQPIIGVSPTRPGSMRSIPVEAPAATVPARSSATAPTVPCRSPSWPSA